jgi:uncharacterized protein (DUF305 family)
VWEIFFLYFLNSKLSKISLPLSVSLIIVSGVLGLSIGYSLTPDYRSSMFDKATMDLGRADRNLDLRYINAMISHHRGAMLLAQQADQKTTRQDMKDLSLKILNDEPKAIEELYTWKKNWYGDTKQVKDPIVSNLGSYDDKFDLRFLNALIAHHDAGLLMTKEVKTKSSRTEILNNADDVETFLTTTLKIFKDWRSQWYNI